VITYRLGTQGGKPDALTRRSQDLLAGIDDLRLASRRRAILKADNADAVVTLAVILDEQDTSPGEQLQLVSSAVRLGETFAVVLTGNTFAVLSDIKDNDDLDGGVKLPPSNDNDDHPAGNDNDSHPASEQDEDNLQDLLLVQEVLRTAYS